MAINNLKNELDYFDFSYQPGLEQSQRISKFVGNIYVSIITYYEESGNIEQTYLSLYNQTFPHWEWLIVTNNIDKTLLDLKKRDKRIKIVEITEERVPKAQYIAAEQANSDIVLLLSEGDLIDKTMLECGYFTMLTNPEGVWAYSRMVNFGAINELYNKKLAIYEMTKKNIISKCAFIRKEKFLELDKYVKFPIDIHENWFMWLFFLSQRYVPIKMDFYGFWHRKNNKQLSEKIQEGDIKKTEIEEEFINKIKQKMDIDKDIDTIQFDDIYQIEYKDIPKKIDITKKDIFEHNTKNKLLFIVPWFVVGGADIFNLNLIKGLREKGYEISVITTQKCDYFLRQTVEKYVDEYFDLTTFLKEKDWASFIYHIIKSRKINCVLITNSFYGYYVLPWLKYHFKDIPFIDYIHAENLTLRNGGFPKDSNSVAHYLDATYTCTKHLKDMMYHLMKRNVKNIKTVYIGTDTNKYDCNVIYSGEDKLAKKYEGKKVILYITRMVHYKRPLFAVEVFKKILEDRNDVQMVMVGDGAAFEDVKEKIEEEKLQKNIHMYGMQEDPRRFYKIADVTLVCSLREGLTLTTYESLSMGVPVVSSNVGGQKEIIEDNCGELIVPYQQPEEQFNFDYSEEEIDEYKIALEKILDNKDNINYKEVCRKKVVEKFSIDKMILNMDKEISRLIKTGSSIDKNFCNNIEFAERYLLVNNMLENLNRTIEKRNKEIDSHK